MNWMNRSLVSFTACVAVCAGAAQPSKKPASPAPALPPAQPLVIDPAAIDEALKALVDAQKLVGVSALVYRGDEEVYFGAFGMADRENSKPMSRDTIVQIFSMTKP